jgi:hypothetical protein
MADYKIVGYVSKAGKLGTYKHTATVKNKFGEGNRVKLESFGSQPVEFWVDENKLVAAPPTARRSGSGCDCPEVCCVPRCSCEAHCNCRGGNIYDC